MTVRVGINGFGRIGRLVMRAALSGRHGDVEVVAINDLTDNSTLANLFEFDSVHGRFRGDVSADAESITINGKRIAASSEKDPSKLPWGKLNVDVVIESTGRFKDKDEVKAHLQAGAKRAILSAPGKGVDGTFVLGVNDRELTANHLVVSNASCTTNCLAPVVAVIDQRFGLVNGVMDTVHAYTNDQNILDAPHKDPRRARAGAVNIVPTSTGAASAVGLVYPKVKGKLHGMALRVPVPDGSACLLIANLARPATAEEVNAAFREAAAGPLAGILRVEDKPIVHSDIIGDSHSSIVDAESTFLVDGTLLHVLSWYDNEWGYACRCVELAHKMGQF
jgi:glyceraldehyde 3-phosphate dehydrogenase